MLIDTQDVVLDTEIGKELYVFLPKTTLDDVLEGDYDVFEIMYFEAEYVDIIEVLATSKAADHSSYILLHGVLAQAFRIPEKLPHGVSAFIILLDDTGVATCIEANSVESINDVVTKIINKSIESDLYMDIDNVYILYGYELTLTLSIDEEEIDRQVLTDCEGTTKEVGNGEEA